MKSSRVLFLVVLIITALVAQPLVAQTTGRLVGSVQDEQKAPMPGISVQVRGPSLQGTRTAISGPEGTYRFTNLPPGEYEVTFTLEGFATESRKGVIVSLGKETAINISMRPALSEQLTVSGIAPVVDVASTTMGTNLTSASIESLPTGRNYSAVAQVSPGISSDANPENKGQSTISIYGSSGAENAYFIDGMNTTNMEYGFQGKELNFEFIQEIDIKTGGYEAEFGRSTGGIINVITKSGGNEFHGDGFGYYDSDSMRQSAKKVVSTGGTVTGYTKSDYGFDIGGYVLKDKLWFYVAYDRAKDTTESALPAGPMEGQKARSESKRDLGSAKLTYQLAGSQSLVATFLQDPRRDTGAINDGNHSLNGDPATYQGRQDFGGSNFALRYDGVFGQSWAATGQIARHQEENSVGPATAAGGAVQLQDAVNDFYQTGGFGLIQKKTFQRDFIGGAVSRYFKGHEVKFGVEYEKESAEVTKYYSGGQLVTRFANPTNPTKPIYSHFYWTTPDATLDNAPISKLVASPKHRNTTAFLQDRWTVLDNLSINIGIRWDRQEIIDASGTRQINLNKDYAPRFGFIWDPTNDHRTKVFGSYGRFYEQIPMDLVIRSFSYERQPRIYNYDPTSNARDLNAEADYGSDSQIYGGFTEPSDPNIRGQYINEYILGIERELIADIAVGVKFVYRNFGEVIEDFQCDADGTYCIGNPGKGIMKEVYGLDYETLYKTPKARRDYRGIQLDFNKRFSNNWQMSASYNYSTLKGNFDGTYAPFTNVGADPNISAMYDYYDFFTDGRNLNKTTSTGYLSNDRRHQLKVSGIYQTPFKLTVGFSSYWRTGTPLSRYGFSDAYGRYEFFLTNRGSEGRNPSTYEADLHLDYPITIKGVTIKALFDVFNLLNAQRAILLDQRWSFQESDNASPTPTNPNYHQPVLRTPPRSVRLGVRVTF